MELTDEQIKNIDGLTTEEDFIFAYKDCDDPDFSIAILEKWVELFDSDNSHAYLGDAYLANNQFGKAIEEYKKILESETYTVVCNDLLSTLYYLGRTTTGKADYQKAYEYAERAIKKYESNKEKYGFPSRAYNTIGLLYYVGYFGLYNQKKCLSYFTEIIKKSDNDELVFYAKDNLSSYYLLCEDYEKSAELAKELLLDTKISNSVYLLLHPKVNLGIIERLLGHNKKANKYFLDVISTVEKQIDVDKQFFRKPLTDYADYEKNALMCYGLACSNLAILNEDKPNVAENYYIRGLKSKHCNSYFLYGAYLFVDKDNSPKAEDILISSFNKTIDESYFVYELLCAIYCSRLPNKIVIDDDPDKVLAIKYGEKAVSLGSTEACLYLGDIYSTKSFGKDKIALDYFKKAYELGSVEAESKIQQLLSFPDDQEEFNTYVQNILKLNINDKELIDRVSSDILKKFGVLSNYISSNVFSYLSASLFIYFVIARNYNDDKADYSSSIISLGKGIERFLKEKAVTPYIAYLSRNKDKYTKKDYSVKLLVERKDKSDFALAEGHIELGKTKFLFQYQATNLQGKKIYLPYKSYIDFLGEYTTLGSKEAIKKFIVKQCSDISEFANLRNTAAHEGALSKLDANRAIISVLDNDVAIKSLLKILKK